MPYAEAIIRRAMPVIEVRRPFATRLGAALALLIALAMFTLSGGVLWTLGINYDGITGSAATKIHIATYLTAMTFLLMLVFSRHPVVFAASALSRNPGAITFLVAALLLGAFIIIDGRRGIATVFDTYLVAGLVVLIVGELDLAGQRRIERLLHVLMTANALLALAETRKAFHADPGRNDSKEEPDVPNGPAIRRVRPKEQGVLFIYAIDPALAGAEAKLSKDTPPVIAFAASFPASRSGARVKYSVNNVFWELEYGGID